MPFGYTQMELRHLRYFVMAAEEGNMSRAAARLHVSQPAVSRQLRDLEEELGVPLFERQSNGLSITDAGQTALTHARQILRQSNAMSEAMRSFSESEHSVTLRIGYLPTALPGFLADGLRRFNDSHRNVCVQIHEMTPLEQEKALQKDEIDLALLGTACPELKKKYRVEPIRKVPLAAVVPDDHRLADRKSIDLAEMAADTFLTLHEDHFPGRPAMMKSIFDRAKISPKISLKVNGLSELLGHVGAGAGVALVPADVDQLPHARVSFIALKRPKTTLVSSAVWRKESETQELLDLFEQIANGADERGSH